MSEQFGPLYWQLNAEIEKPINDTYLRLFRELSDGLYYVKKSDGTLELFSTGLGASLALFQDLATTHSTDAAETTLFNDLISANKIASNGYAVEAKYAVTFANTMNAKVLRAYLDGQLIFQTTHDYSGGTLFDLDVNIELIRTGTDSARVVASYTTNEITESKITLLTGLDFTANMNLGVTGQAVVTNDILGIFSKGMLLPASV